MKKQNCRRIERLMLVLVSCVIIVVALLNLLHPATAQAEQATLATGTDVQCRSVKHRLHIAHQRAVKGRVEICEANTTRP